MHIQFAGYDIESNSRIYNFDVVDPPRKAREFTVRAAQCITIMFMCTLLGSVSGLCCLLLQGRQVPARLARPEARQIQLAAPGAGQAAAAGAPLARARR